MVNGSLGYMYIVNTIVVHGIVSYTQMLILLKYKFISHISRVLIVGVRRTPMYSTRPVFKNPKFEHTLVNCKELQLI